MPNTDYTKIKEELFNAVKLFILLILLFWSFTWNSSDPNFNFPEPKQRKDKALETVKDVSSSKNDVSVLEQHSVLIETFKTVQNTSRKSSNRSVPSSGGILPPFNEWKETERIKYEKLSSKNSTAIHHKKPNQRKLNYASEKCGAKILASNPGARHRKAILNEKPDEYMLNRCKVKMWFVIELCDTVEATQVEIANYELYSSSPKEFSVFWSEIYPTSAWHLLGTFEAKDQRTMQTFHLNTKNLGKFIKVILYSHHGKEHYCLLSVIRVLGYSMVEKLEDIEENEKRNSVSDNVSGIQFDKNSTAEKMKNNGNIQDKSFQHSNGLPFKLCSVYFKHCSEQTRTDSGKACSNKLMCRFITQVLYKHLIYCSNLSLCTANKTMLLTANAMQDDKQGESSYMPNIFPWSVTTSAKKVTESTPSDVINDYEFFNAPNQSIDASVLHVDDETDENFKTVIRNLNVQENFTDAERFNKQDKSTSHEASVHTISNYGEKYCSCDKGKTAGKMFNGNKDTMKEAEEDLSMLETDVDSAGLIQKESVLFKLTTRIRASEIDLSLINKYLQQLSQSYREQMEDMQAMFNRTVKAIDAASEKAALIDEKQQENLDSLQKNVVILTRKVNFLMNGQRDMITRVFEMHAFFIILEIIVISAIFTILMNIFHQKNTLIKQRILYDESTRVV